MGLMSIIVVKQTAEELLFPQRDIDELAEKGNSGSARCASAWHWLQCWSSGTWLDREDFKFLTEESDIQRALDDFIGTREGLREEFDHESASYRI